MPYRNNYYTIYHEREFIRNLGCHRYPHVPVERMAELRTDQEFDRLLNLYLHVNGQRTDPIGLEGCQFAQEMLRKLTG